MEERDEQKAKVKPAIDVIEAGRLISSRAEHSWNEFRPMDVIESDRLIFLRAEQLKNELVPTDVIESGRLISRRAEHFWNEYDPIDVIDLGMITICNDLKGVNTPLPIDSPSAMQVKVLGIVNSI